MAYYRGAVSGIPSVAYYSPKPSANFQGFASPRLQYNRATQLKQSIGRLEIPEALEVETEIRRLLERSDSSITWDRMAIHNRGLPWRGLPWERPSDVPFGLE